MPDGRDAIAIRLVERIADIPAAEWDACARGGTSAYNPFVSHAFLSALEESGSATAKSGWQPYHLTIEDSDGRLYGALPTYVKNHSQGEYVFDHGWAHAYERAGGHYYPKLQCAVPFSPVSGPRLLVRADTPDSALSPDDARKALAAGLIEATRQLGVSSAHVTFCTRQDAELLETMGFLVRHGHQFHWHNRDYENFEGFLAALTSRKRKSIRRERQKVAEMGIKVRALTGADIKPYHWDDFHRFYVDTYDRKWGYPYLTRAFFDLLHETMVDDVVLMMAERDGRNIAGALNLRGGDALFGRNWGCDQDFKFLHFEACYYSAIDFAIEHGLKRVEAGTQGPHKVHRGYEPVHTYSAHWIKEANFRDAVDQFLRQERQLKDEEINDFKDFSPYRTE
jgi:predicted N-acyltransferase